MTPDQIRKMEELAHADRDKSDVMNEDWSSFSAYKRGYRAAMELMEEQRVVAVLGGGDWDDARVDLIAVPKDLNLENEMINYTSWYRDDYIPRLRASLSPKYFSFSEWLIKFKRASKDTGIEEFST